MLLNLNGINYYIINKVNVNLYDFTYFNKFFGARGSVVG
jgi:hypothetical protein